jgi:hypothetical protein
MVWMRAIMRVSDCPRHVAIAAGTGKSLPQAAHMAEKTQLLA